MKIPQHLVIPSMPFFEYNTTKIHFVDVDTRLDPSDGLPLVFVHGGGSSHFCWAFQLMTFSRTNRCIAIDLSGHGKSDKSDTAASIENEYAYEVAALIEHLELHEFILIGHSMGGAVALSYVLNPKFRRPKALVLVDSAPVLKLVKVTPGLIKEVIEEQRHLRDHSFYDYAEENNLEKYEKAMRYVDAFAMQRDLLACNAFDVSKRMNEIDIPTFALVGEGDDVVNPTTVKAYVDELPRGDLAVVRGAHHVSMVEQPEEFNRLFQKFILWVQKSQ